MLLANIDKDFSDYVLIKFAVVQVALQNSFVAPRFKKCEATFSRKFVRIVITLLLSLHIDKLFYLILCLISCFMMS